MAEEKVSVIVPIYNVEKYLRRCLDSIINQTYRNLEIILVDDGSPDTCGAICDEYAEKDPRIKVIHQENGGVSTARNNGIAQSNGKYIVFVDGDDYVLPDYVLGLMDETDSDYVASGCYVQKGETVWDIWLNTDNTLSINDIHTDPEKIELVPIGTVWAKRYKSCILKEANILFETTVSRGEDTLFNTQYLLSCQSVSIHKRADYCYCLSESNATSKYSPNLFRWSMRSLQNIGRLIGDENDIFYEYVWNNAIQVCDDWIITGQKNLVSLFFRLFEMCNNEYVRRSLRYGKTHGKSKRAYLMQLYLFPPAFVCLLLVHNIRAFVTIKIKETKREGK